MRQPSGRLVASEQVGRRGRRPSRRGAFIALGLGLTLLAAWHYSVLARSLLEVRSGLLEVESDLRAVGLSAQPDDLVAARATLEDTGAHVARAERHLRRDPLLLAAGYLPAIGDQLHAVNSFVDIADTLVEAGTTAVVLGEDLLAARGESEAREESLTVFAVDALERLEPQLTALAAAADRLVDQRLELGDAPLLAPLDDARRRLDEELPNLAITARRGLEARAVLDDILGFNGERRYMLFAVNNAELLPGGGLVSVGGVLTVTDGAAGDLDMGDTGRWKPRWEELGGQHIPPPGPLDRYLLRGFTWTLGTVNWTPDYPTWAQQALELYELAWGPQDVDGVIAVDLEVLRRLLEITGPLDLPTEGYGVLHLTPENAVVELEAVTREAWLPGSDQKAPIGDLAALMLSRLLFLPVEQWDDLATTVAALGRERHLQALFFAPEEQSLVRNLEMSGHLVDVSGDYLQFNEASLNSTKLNLLIRPEGSYAIDVSALGDARHRLTLRYRNTLPEWSVGRDPELLRKLFHDGLYGGYMRVFTPPGIGAPTVSVDGAAAGIEDRGREGPYAWFGTFMSLPAGAAREAEFRWIIPLATTAPRASEYDLYIQKQPGAPAICVELEVTREGVPPRELTIEGGYRDDRGRLCISTDVEIHATF